MKIKGFLFIFILFLFYSCGKVTPRRPINPKPSTTILEEILEESKLLNNIEEEKIKQVILLDSLATYHLSSFGFWYTYDTKIEKDLPKPILGDEVVFEYEISDLQNKIIYSKEDLGVKNYSVDKEDIISGIQKGIKLMKVGETITFVIPSYNAFGVSGDGNKIGINQSIKSTITLLRLNK